MRPCGRIVHPCGKRMHPCGRIIHPCGKIIIRCCVLKSPQRAFNARCVLEACILLDHSARLTRGERCRLPAEGFREASVGLLGVLGGPIGKSVCLWHLWRVILQAARYNRDRIYKQPATLGIGSGIGSTGSQLHWG